MPTQSSNNGRDRLVRRRRVVYAAGIAAGAVAIWIAVGVATWPREDSMPSPPPTVVVALASDILSDSTLDDPGTARLERAIEVARQTGAPIVTTRILDPAHGRSSDGPQRRMLDRAGLGTRWTVAPAIVHSTREEALALRAALPDSTRIAVVTSPLHSRRACAVFERVGFRVTCVTSRQYPWWLVAYGYVYERLAVIKYRHNGWM